MMRRSMAEGIKPEPLATPAEVAKMLGDIPEHTLAQWRSRGTGPEYIKVGRHVRYRWSAVNTWLDQQSSVTGVA
jgi:predicted DNA-binding transcriptional regulator AlpA